VGAGRPGTAWASLLTGVASVAVLPAGVYASRVSDTFDLIHAGFLIPVVVVLALSALVLARRAGRRMSVSLAGGSGQGLVTGGRVLGIIGLCIAASALVALAVYGLLEYVGSRG
jgi:hypothetical protein